MAICIAGCFSTDLHHMRWQLGDLLLMYAFASSCHKVATGLTDFPVLHKIVGIEMHPLLYTGSLDIHSNCDILELHK